MIFEWHEHKRQTNLFKHRLDFADCAAVFAGDVLTLTDDRFDYGESRSLALGLLEGLVVVVAFVQSGDAVRIISMRKASKREQETYFQSFGDGLGAT